MTALMGILAIGVLVFVVFIATEWIAELVAQFINHYFNGGD